MQIILLATIFIISMKAKYRIIFVLLAPVIVLGNPNITNAKILYFIMLAIINLFCNTKVENEYTSKIVRKMIRVNILVLILILIIVILGSLNNYSTIEILRSTIIYTIFLLNFRLVVSSSKFWNIHEACNLMFVIGFIGALTTFYTWVQRRGLLDFSSERIGLDADYYAIFAISVSISLIVQESKYINKYLNLVLVSILSLLLLATLSRTYFVLLITIILFTLIKGKRTTIPQIKFALKIILLTTGAAYLIIRTLDSTQFRIVQSRIFNSLSLLFENRITNDNSYLESLSERKRQASLAYEIWKSSPIFGTGVMPSQYSFDSIIATVAKFGIFGSIVILIIFANVNRISKILTKGNSIRTGVQTSILIILIPSSFIGNWPENKSIWLICNFIFFLILVEASQQRLMKS